MRLTQPRIGRRVRHAGAVLAALLLTFGATPYAAPAAPAAGMPSWGAIATGPGARGYAYNHPDRAAAEQMARAQCERAARRGARCEVRAAFDRACAALAQGNFGEWGAAVAPTVGEAARAAAQQCDAHLPTEPCKPVLRFCSPS